MQLFWNTDGKLNFKAYKKEDQQIKYVDSTSAHTSATRKAIPTGVFTRLSGLTSKTTSNGKKHLDELYPEHAAALKKPTWLQKDSLNLKTYGTKHTSKKKKIIVNINQAETYTL